MGPFAIDDLATWLQENRSRIDFVKLTWEISGMHVLIETNNVMAEGDHKGEHLMACFNCSNVDREYSFIGNVDEAIEHAVSYGCWDGFDGFELDHGILMAYNDKLVDGSDSWFVTNKSYLQDEDLIDALFTGFVYWSGNRYSWYLGEIERR